MQAIAAPPACEKILPFLNVNRNELMLEIAGEDWLKIGSHFAVALRAGRRNCVLRRWKDRFVALRGLPKWG